MSKYVMYFDDGIGVNKSEYENKKDMFSDIDYLLKEEGKIDIELIKKEK